ncbi:hypothetical protein [Streptomyces sp. CT34]|uniref:hypothetical protein n=1 Tax=Streptomyces sp. CT34 TaxID=1553907 RepID=UPI0005B96A45|nr:hypothetical protein [Streptomyces sp. CT34]
MRNNAPAYEDLLDHTGKPRPSFDMALSYEQVRLGLAFHEAGHAVLSMAYGVHVVSSEVIAWQPSPDRWSVTGKTASEAHDVSPWHYAAQCAAGELAHVQYLLTSGLWTPQLAAGCAADHDREKAIDVLARFGYRLGRDHTPQGGKSWGMVRGIARRKVDRLWPEICAVARAIDAADIVTGEQIADLTGLPNPPHPGPACLGGAA